METLYICGMSTKLLPKEGNSRTEGHLYFTYTTATLHSLDFVSLTFPGTRSFLNKQTHPPNVTCKVAVFFSFTLSSSQGTRGLFYGVYVVYWSVNVDQLVECYLSMQEASG